MLKLCLNFAFVNPLAPRAHGKPWDIWLTKKFIWIWDRKLGLKISILKKTSKFEIGNWIIWALMSLWVGITDNGNSGNIKQLLPLEFLS